MKHDLQDKDEYPLEPERPMKLLLGVAGFVTLFIGAIAEGPWEFRVALISLGLVVMYLGGLFQ